MAKKEFGDPWDDQGWWKYWGGVIEKYFTAFKWYVIYCPVDGWLKQQDIEDLMPQELKDKLDAKVAELNSGSHI